MQHKIYLNGTWKFRMDTEKEGLSAHFELQSFTDTINLPSTVSESRKGKRDTGLHINYLTDPYAMEGYCWYQKEISIPLADPDSLSSYHFLLTLERTRTSYIWVDGVFAGSLDSLCAMHRYDLTGYIRNLTPVITIMVSNTDYKIPDVHMISPNTQTNWNGILGEISLDITEDIRIAGMEVRGDFEHRAGIFHIKVENSKDRSCEAALCIRPILCRLKKEYCAMDVPIPGHAKFEELTEAVSLPEQTGYFDIMVSPGMNEYDLTLDLSGSAKLWDEEEPYLYQATAELFGPAGKSAHSRTIFFGICSFTAGRDAFYINGRKTFLRGKHDALLFPETGYAPMDLGSWLRVMKIARDFGINHYRFHTCCPPEAAFLAADLLGIYVEAELPFSGYFYGPSDQEYNRDTQEYLEAEGFRILEAFSNHPSFRMMSMGNELLGNGEAINALIKKFKSTYPHILYTQGSNNFQWTPEILPEEDFFCGVRFSRDRLIRGSYAMCDSPQGHVQTQEPGTRHNYDEAIRPSHTMCDSPRIPVVSHEIGQYEVYPDYRELERYTGVLKPENLREFRRRLAAKNLLSMAEDYFRCSGALAVACYRDELETAFRCAYLAGFQILDIQDFTGQGTALVGVLNSFMENKGLISAPQWRRFCSDAVLLAEFDRYVAVSGESFDFSVSVSYFRKNPLPSCRLICRLIDRKGRELYSYREKLPELTENGRYRLCHTCFPVKGITAAESMTLTVELEGTNIRNSYTLWVYPAMRQEDTQPQVVEDCAIINRMQDLLEAAENARACLLFLGSEYNIHSIEGTYCTDFWCYPMFNSISLSRNVEQPVGTMGLLIRKDHPALSAFPCEAYTTPQWYSIIKASRSTILDDTDIVPVVQTIDNFERNHRLGMIYEIYLTDLDLAVLVCTSDLPALCREGRAEAETLYHSLVSSLSGLAKREKMLYHMEFRKFAELVSGEIPTKQ